MSTNCVVKFGADAAIYNHWDGYPSHMKGVIRTFFEAVKLHVKDTRFNDMSYLAAKYVVFKARDNAGRWDYDTDKFVPSHPLEFLSLGVVEADRSEEYEYRIHEGDWHNPQPGKFPRVSIISRYNPDENELEPDVTTWPLDKRLCELWDVPYL